MRFLASLFACAALCLAQPGPETGELNGAQYRIDRPEKWNGILLMYCHGYSPAPGRFDNPKPNPAWSALTAQGYAVAQSGYSTGGWAVAEAVRETEELRRHFTASYGKPKETYVMGHSMGGFLTMALVELHPDSYDGGLALCGPLAPTTWFMLRRTFDLRVVFDYFFPGALPPPDKVPADFRNTPEVTAQVSKLLDGKPDAAAQLRRWSGIKTDKELAATAAFFTYILKDLRQRGGGNAFDNRDTIYDGTSDDNALNAGVTRYQADEGAAAYVRRYYTPSGKLSRPLLAIHTTYDPLVPPWVASQYSLLAREAASGRWFVQQYVQRDGHCQISGEEIGRGLVQLREWKTTGKRPPSGAAR